MLPLPGLAFVAMVSSKALPSTLASIMLKGTTTRFQTGRPVVKVVVMVVSFANARTLLYVTESGS